MTFKKLLINLAPYGEFIAIFLAIFFAVSVPSLWFGARWVFVICLFVVGGLLTFALLDKKSHNRQEKSTKEIETLLSVLYETQQMQLRNLREEYDRLSKLASTKQSREVAKRWKDNIEFEEELLKENFNNLNKKK